MALTKRQWKEIAKWDKLVKICSEHVRSCNCQLVALDAETGLITVSVDGSVYAAHLDTFEMEVAVADVTAVYRDGEGFVIPFGTCSQTCTGLEMLMRVVRELPTNRTPGDRSQIRAVS